MRQEFIMPFSSDSRYAQNPKISGFQLNIQNIHFIQNQTASKNEAKMRSLNDIFLLANNHQSTRVAKEVRADHKRMKKIEI